MGEQARDQYPRKLLLLESMQAIIRRFHQCADYQQDMARGKKALVGTNLIILVYLIIWAGCLCPFERC